MKAAFRPLRTYVLLIALVAIALNRPAHAADAEPLPTNVFKNLAAGKKQTVVVYGTSLSAFAEWPKAMKAYFDKHFPDQVTFINAAQSGRPSEWGLQQLETRVLSKNPDLVFIEFSINDSVPRYNISKEQSVANLDTMVKSLRQKNPQVDIVVQTMSTVWDTPVNPGRTAASDRPQYVEYYDAYRNYAREQGLPLVDHYPNWVKLQKEDEATYKKWLADGTHPIAEGSLAVTWPAIEAMLEKARTAAGPSTQSSSPATQPSGALIPMNWFSLDGKPVPSGNAPDENGLVRKFNAPVLGVSPTPRSESRGTVLLFPGGAYSILDVLNEGSRTTQALNNFGYDVAMLEYHVSSGEKTRDLALEDASAALRLIKEKPQTLGIKPGRTVVMGYSAGGHLAARAIQNLPAEQQPDDVVLVYPAYLDERAADASTPLVRPPAQLKSRLVTVTIADDRATWINSAREYTESWQSAGGYGVFFQFKTGGHGFGMKPDLSGDLAQWPNILNYFLENGPKPGVGPFNTVLPWFLPNVEGRMAAYKNAKDADQGAVVFLGDSITSQWRLADSFGGIKVANRGISGDTTRGMLCRIQEHVLDLHPKAIVFLGGINDFTQQPKGTPQTIAANVRLMLEEIRKVSPNTPVLICETLPSRNASAEALRATNAAVDQVIEGFPNAHRVKTYQPFLKEDGTQNTALFRDGTHLTAEGYAVWQEVLEPELLKYVQRN